MSVSYKKLWKLLIDRDMKKGSGCCCEYQHILQKLEEERQPLGGRVFDILGIMTFDNRSD